MNKQQEIIDIALKLFSKNGFNETSVQVIAENAGISKGGFYSYFASKTDLMIVMIENYHKKIIDRTIEIDSIYFQNNDLATYIEWELKTWIEHQPFFNVLFKEFSPKKDATVTQKMEQLRTTLENHHRDILYRVLGKAYEIFFSDLSIILEGIMKEYLVYMTIHQQDINAKQLSEWIASLLNTIVKEIRNKKPLIQKEQEITWEQLIIDIQDKIIEMKSDNHLKLLEALQIVKNEIVHDSAYSLTAEAFLYYLKREKTIHSQVLMLERLCKQLGGQ
ncbi:transcriptional regulator [Gracilibacillus boraciitolerans JCM 21714]|uniref:Transcriptional regulator n=1 Tax=Gracilibacillus boraciitolerans JCM 21714 TaxID=1298598 RepID=W4VP96_9BACI|nr:TetR/AcrR family transcriptional regulator [Gracilibacillus boraciitolerans]GAE94981.1 transcriptional regulator [Gracilibacillus boraciitolerans JCM 21714]